MICPKCGHESTGNFCSHCGAFLRSGELPGAEERSNPDRRLERPLAGRNSLTPDGENNEGIGENIPDSDVGSSDLSVRRGRSRRREDLAAADRASERTGIAAEGTRTQAPGSRGEKSPAEKSRAEKSRAEKSLAEKTEAEKSQAEKARAEKSQAEKPQAEKSRAEKSRAEKPRSGGGKSASSDKRSAKKAERAEKKADKAEKKEVKQKDERIARQFKEAREREEQLNLRIERMDRERLRRETDREDPDEEYGGGTGQRLGEAAAKGAVGLIVLGSRLMQLCSCFLMGYMVWTAGRSFWIHQEGLGLLTSAVDERNYGLLFYTGFAGITLFMGAVWCLWILSRKAAGGNVRLKKYDTGRGFIPFLFCAAAVAAVGAAITFVPQDPAAWEGAALGVRAAFMAVNDHRELLLFCSILGAALSLVRKILRV